MSTVELWEDNKKTSVEAELKQIEVRKPCFAVDYDL